MLRKIVTDNLSENSLAHISLSETDDFKWFQSRQAARSILESRIAWRTSKQCVGVPCRLCGKEGKSFMSQFSLAGFQKFNRIVSFLKSKLESSKPFF